MSRYQCELRLLSNSAFYFVLFNSLGLTCPEFLRVCICFKKILFSFLATVVHLNHTGLNLIGHIWPVYTVMEISVGYFVRRQRGNLGELPWGNVFSWKKKEKDQLKFSLGKLASHMTSVNPWLLVCRTILFTPLISSSWKVQAGGELSLLGARKELIFFSVLQ